MSCFRGAVGPSRSLASSKVLGGWRPTLPVSEIPEGSGQPITQMVVGRHRTMGPLSGPEITSMARVLIAGCGYTGIALGTQLASEGHAVWGLRRRPELLPATIHPLKADLCDPASLALIPPELDFVFYTAAAERTDDASYQAAYVTGIQNLLNHLSETHQSLHRIFFTSSTAVYGIQAASGWMKLPRLCLGSFPDVGSWKEKSCS